MHRQHNLTTAKMVQSSSAIPSHKTERQFQQDIWMDNFCAWWYKGSLFTEVTLESALIAHAQGEIKHVLKFHSLLERNHIRPFTKTGVAIAWVLSTLQYTVNSWFLEAPDQGDSTLMNGSIWGIEGIKVLHHDGSSSSAYQESEHRRSQLWILINPVYSAFEPLITS